MTFNHARIGGLSAVAFSLLISACQVTATGQVTPGTVGSASPAASGSPGATSSARPSASPTAATSASPTTGASASPAASASPTASPATGGKTGDAEPNDDFATASMGAWDTPISGTVGGGDTKGDYYKLVVPAGNQDGWLTVTMSETSEDYGPTFDYFESDKSPLGNSTYADSATQDPVEGKMRVKAGNTYYVKLSPHAQDETVNYTVTFKFTPVADPNERNDTFETATPLTLGTKTTFATFWADDDSAKDDLDNFKVTLPAGMKHFRVEIKNNTTSDDAGSYTVNFFKMDKSSAGNSIYGSSQQDITGEDALSGELEPGDYYIQVTGSNTDALSELTVTAEAGEQGEE